MPYQNAFRLDRQRLMQDLLSFIQKNSPVDIDFTLGMGGLKYGSTETALTNMLNQLEKANAIEIDLETRRITYILGMPEQSLRKPVTDSKEKTPSPKKRSANARG